LLANIAAFYAVYHGPAGIQAIAERVHSFATRLAAALSGAGWSQTNATYFDTVRFPGDDGQIRQVRPAAEGMKINFRYPLKGVIQVSFDETVTEADLADVVRAFEAAGAKATVPSNGDAQAGPLARTSAFLTHAVFNSHSSETEMM